MIRRHIVALIHLLVLPIISVLLWPAEAAAQGGLANGGDHAASISTAGEIDEWTFTADLGDTAILSIAEIVRNPDTGFYPWIRVYNPLGALVYGGNEAGALAAQVAFTATLTGTYTVWVASYDSGFDAVGDYVLRLAKAPGAFTVPAGDQGGPLANGGNYPGRIEIGDLDMWSFDANQNDTAIVSIGEIPVGSGTPDPGFYPWIRVYNPLGALVYGGSEAGALAAQVAFTATLTGTYTVVVASYDSGFDAVGDYVLRLAKAPGVFSVPTDDHGGPLIDGTSHPGRIEIGDLDMWSFTACAGSALTVNINEVPVGPGVPDPGFFPWIRVYNALGALVSGGSQAGNTTAQVSTTATVSGLFTVVVGTYDSGFDATGDYTVRVQTTAGACGPPTTVADGYTATTNTALTIAAPGVLGNDNTNGGGPMTAELVSSVTAGTLVLNANGSFTFTPPTGFTGATSFTYRAVNGFGAGNTATVTIGVIQGPTTVADSYPTVVNIALTVAAPGVLANDNSNGGGTMTAQLVSTVSSGTLALNANGSFTYTPPAGFTGSTSFRYRAVNGVGPGNTADVTLTVNPIPPTTVDDPSYTTPMNTPLNTPAPGVLGNDLTNGGGAMSAQLVTTTTNGILALAADGSFAYTPTAGFHGGDSFTYRAVNSVGPGNTATVSIAVQNTTDPQPPTDLYAASITGNTVTLRFTPPTTGPAPTGYVLEGGLSPGETLAAIPTGSAAPASVRRRT
jgi:trimeric autotransporter adhesin